MKFIKKFRYGLGILLLFQFLFFFTVFLGNQSARQEAINYYFDSGLYRIEFPIYTRFLQKYLTNNVYFKRLENISSENVDNKQIYWLIFFDPFFQNELKSGDMLKKSTFYNDWLKKREQYKNLLNNDHLLTKMFNSYEPKLINVLFSFFSTENYFQFFINCGFLLIVGFFLEAKVSSLLFLESFFLGGVLMLSSYCLLAPYCLIPLAASNGGVASLVGFMISFLFSRQVITFSSIAAFIILPAWILVQYVLFLLLDINLINVVSQIPSILGGMIIGFYLKRITLNSGERELLVKTPKDLA